MQFKTSYIKVQKTARYATYGELSEKTKYFWFCLHGSNMLCEQILYKFSDFNEEEHFVISAEGLSRFYAKGMQGDVVACWMTKRDRLNEIQDFSDYLSQLHEKYSEHLPKGTKRIILGFSQGGTTAYRWLHQTKVKVDYLIPYSCWIPEDINLRESKTKLNDLKTIYTYGIHDQYLNDERIVVLKEIISKNELKISIEPYEGIHRIEKTNLKNLFENFIQ